MLRSDFLSFNGQKLVRIFKADKTLRRRIAEFIERHDDEQVTRLLKIPRKALARIANGFPLRRESLDLVRRKLDEHAPITPAEDQQGGPDHGQG